MLSASQRGWSFVVPAGPGLMRPAVRDAVQLAVIVLALACAVAFGPDVASRFQSGATSPRESAASVRLADGERALQEWVNVGAAGSRASLVEERNIARFLSERYRVAREDVAQVVSYAYRTGRETGLDPLLLLAVMSIESSLDPAARSPKGAQGLMQVLTRVHEERFEPFGGPAAAFEPLPNIRVGAAILKEYLVREGSIEGALKSYVGAALREHDGGYGAKVLAERERIALAARGRSA